MLEKLSPELENFSAILMKENLNCEIILVRRSETRAFKRSPKIRVCSN